MQENAKIRLIDQLDGTGISVQDVLIQDIAFDPRISQQILDTQIRIQQEEKKKSEEKIAITDAKIKQQVAIGNANKKREEASAEAFRLREVSTAEKDATIARAEGESQAIKLIASANTELTRSLTPQILEKQRLDNEGVLFSKSKGSVPSTVIGKTDLRAYGVPIYQSSN